MGKNLTGGKNRRKGKNMSIGHKRELRLCEDGQFYGRVEKMLGDCRVECLCSDGMHRIAHIRGKFRKRIWISTGDIVLLSLREFQDEKADVIHKYTSDEASSLTQLNEIRFQDSSKTSSASLHDLLLQEDTSNGHETTEDTSNDIIHFDDI